MASDMRLLIVISGMAFEAEIAHGKGIKTIHGLNSAKLRDDIIQAVQEGASGILSFGTAAGLMPELSPGTIIIGNTIWSDKDVIITDAAWSQILCARLPEALHDGIAGCDQPLTSIHDKASLRERSGAAIADMESHHAARIAQRFNLPFTALRVVLDDARQDLPPAALAGIRPDGSIDYGRLLASLLKQPIQLPAMLKLGRHHVKAKTSLLRCRDLLRGSRFDLDLR